MRLLPILETSALVLSLANKSLVLLKLAPSADELDSFMFQTVGLNHLPLIAQSLRLPLYTRTITGTAVNVAGEYGDRKGVADVDEREEKNESGGGTAGDETEDLWELLKEVKVSRRIPLSRFEYINWTQLIAFLRVLSSRKTTPTSKASPSVRSSRATNESE